jgi:translation initiation factor 1A
MPNLRGGKAYKKGKKVANDKEEVVNKFLQRESDQEYARVIRMLGNRRVICFCNDGRERNCKIRGALCKGPKKQKIMVGDIVLLSFRDFEEDSDTDPEYDATVQHSGIADIIYKFHRDHWRHIKMESIINTYLFSTDEPGQKLDDLFDYVSGEEGEGEGEGDAAEKKAEKTEKAEKPDPSTFTDIADDDIDAI